LFAQLGIFYSESLAKTLLQLGFSQENAELPSKQRVSFWINQLVKILGNWL
jgi:hypothetical protein